MFANNSLTREAQPGSLCSPSDCHPLFSSTYAKGELAFSNPLSAMKPFSFKLSSIKVAAFYETKFLAMSFLFSAPGSLVPLFFFLTLLLSVVAFCFHYPCSHRAQLLLDDFVLFAFLVQCTLP